ncbi:MAG: TIGR03619 family F420-dependent LLM class oxidoreductase [Actinomycetes bacterium]
MQVGFAVPVAGSWATPDRQVEIARRAEELGYASLWTFQRLLFPAEESEAANPRWQPVYRSVHDPLITLAFLAAHTSRARLGVAVLNMPWFSPLLLAKQAATLDHVSRGRLDLGLGLGWSQQEYDAVGVPMSERGARAEEFVTCLTSIWTQHPVRFDGRYYKIRPAHVDPAPVQLPHPPVLLGGMAEAALRRAGRLAQGWISSSGQNLLDIGSAIEIVRKAAVEAGRDPSTLRFVSRGVVRVRPAGQVGRRPLTGSFPEIRADLETLARQGVTEVFVDLNFDREIGSVDADPDESMRRAHEVLLALAPQGPGPGVF